MNTFIFVDKRSESEGFEVSSSVSNGKISGNNCTPETVNITIQDFHFSNLLSTLSKHTNNCRLCSVQSLKLADLDISESAEDVSSSISL